jgi:plastocyanin
VYTVRSRACARLLRPLLAGLLLLLLVPLTFTEAYGGTTVQVAIAGFRYRPAAAGAQVGDTLMWTNNDGVDHTVTLDSNPARTSGHIHPGQSFSAVASKAGTFAYHCSIHPFMHGSVTVS